MDLSHVKHRAALKPRREPYWQRVEVGQFLGYRPSTVGDAGSWIARAYDPETRGQRYRALGDYENLAASERHKAAKKEATDWFAHLGAGGSHKSTTVREACERYAKLRPQEEAKLRRLVYGDPIATVVLSKLTKKHVKDWRDRLESAPALVTRSKKGKVKTKRRAPSTINRDMVPFRAALNMALEDGHVLSSQPWLIALKPHEAAGSRRDIYLDIDQRRTLVKALPADSAAFVRGLCLLPLRPGALAALTVSNFDARRSQLEIPDDKNGKGRCIVLPPDTAELFRQQCKSKLPGALLFMRANGTAWNRDNWNDPIKEILPSAQLPAETTAYALRHSVITDLVTGGLDLFTVGQLSDTSIEMIEKHYGHLRQEHAAKALATLVL